MNRLYDTVRYRVSGATPVEAHYRNMVLLIPDFLMLLLRISRDGRLPRRHRVLAGAAVAYLASPLDFIPSWLFGPAGFVDDLTVTLFVLRQVIAELPEYVVLEHWSGDPRLIPLVRRLVESSDAWMRAGMRFKMYTWMRNALGNIARV
ncbi:MAG: DUF1232 domain-containing protein [Bacillota bacterium]|nr:DUF1232 domain-containing protein [Bacillota bacterium]